MRFDDATCAVVPWADTMSSFCSRSSLISHVGERVGFLGWQVRSTAALALSLLRCQLRTKTPHAGPIPTLSHTPFLIICFCGALPLVSARVGWLRFCWVGFGCVARWGRHLVGDRREGGGGWHALPFGGGVCRFPF